jgi:hypothetical protein
MEYECTWNSEVEFPDLSKFRFGKLLTGMRHTESLVS